MTTNNIEFPEWVTLEARHTLRNGYLQEGETFYDAMDRVASSSAKYLLKEGLNKKFVKAFQKDIYDVLIKSYLGLASPVFSNLGVEGRGLPISCFSVSVPDSVSGIFDTLQETAIMTKSEGGVGIFFGRVRSAGSPVSSGGHTMGVIPFAKLYDSTASVVSQGKLRRGSFALYLPIEHPDIKEFLLAKDHTQGDSRRWIDSNIAVTITDDWIKSMLAGDTEKRKLFVDVITTRLKCGSPYIVYIDNVNNANPEAYIKNDLKVEVSNLCSEITLYTDKDHSFVCCLSSLNLDKYDEWRTYSTPNLGLSVPYISTIFLDAVLSEFIDKASAVPELSKAVRSAIKGRALGQ